VEHGLKLKGNNILGFNTAKELGDWKTLNEATAGHVEGMRKMHRKVQSENWKRITDLGGTVVDARVILKWILKILRMRTWNGFILLSIVSGGGFM
jgi:hypothetical protein